MPKKIIVVGSTGQVGRALCHVLTQVPSFEVVKFDRNAPYGTHQDALCAWIASLGDVECIVNCAAYTAVDAAQSQPEKAWQGNVELPSRLARVGVPLIHLSTDYVFDGRARTPYTEASVPCPQTVYGQSKWLGEQAVSFFAPTGVILRTSWVYSSAPGTHNFFHTMRRLARERDALAVVDDQVGCPTYADDLAQACVYLIAHGWHQKPLQTLHFCNEGAISWYEFAKHILALSNLFTPLKPITSAQYPTPAPRPAYSVLSLEKAQRLGLPTRPWLEALTQAIEVTRSES